MVDNAQNKSLVTAFSVERMHLVRNGELMDGLTVQFLQRSSVSFYACGRLNYAKVRDGLRRPSLLLYQSLILIDNSYVGSHVRVRGDGRGGGSGSYLALVASESDDRMSFTVVVPPSVGAWCKQQVLRRHCVVLDALKSRLVALWS